jgi:hypothetical protein
MFPKEKGLSCSWGQLKPLTPQGKMVVSQEIREVLREQMNLFFKNNFHDK